MSRLIVSDDLEEAESLLLGRKTYEGFAAAWPEREGPFADKFNSMPKYVVSSTLTDPEWENTTMIGIDRRRRAEGGRRLSDPGERERPVEDMKLLKLTDAISYDSGVALLIYRPA